MNSIRDKISAARLRERMTFRRPVLNDDGDPVDWELVVRNLRVGIDAMKLAEQDVANGRRTAAGYIVWARAEEVARFGIDATCRGEWNGKLFDVKDVPGLGLPAGHLVGMQCVVGVNQG